jgi:hypothetical protein
MRFRRSNDFKFIQSLWFNFETHYSKKVKNSWLSTNSCCLRTINNKGRASHLDASF